MSYLIALAVVVSLIQSLRSDHLKITTLAKNSSKQSQDKWDENIDPNKIIDLSNRQALLDNIKSLPNITDKLIYGLNTLIPPRRLEYRFVIITDETNPDMLKDANNCLVIRGKWQFVFNGYKTAKSLEQQIVPMPDDLKEILLSYIKSKKLSIGDYLFHLDRSKKEIISQPLARRISTFPLVCPCFENFSMSRSISRIFIRWELQYRQMPDVDDLSVLGELHRKAQVQSLEHRKQVDLLLLYKMMQRPTVQNTGGCAHRCGPLVALVSTRAATSLH